MTKLSGWTFLIVGLIISLSSNYINMKNGTNELLLFIIAGIIFIFIGLIKLTFMFLERYKDKKKIQKKQNRPHPSLSQSSGNPQLNEQKNINSHHHQHNTPQMKCPRCGKPVTHQGYYCVYCGTKVR